jgi:hypothetical protein
VGVWDALTSPSRTGPWHRHRGAARRCGGSASTYDMYVACPGRRRQPGRSRPDKKPVAREHDPSQMCHSVISRSLGKHQALCPCWLSALSGSCWCRLAAVDTSRYGCDPHGSQSLRTPAAPSERSRDGVGDGRGRHPRIPGPDQRQLGSTAVQGLPSRGQRRGRPSRTRTGPARTPWHARRALGVRTRRRRPRSALHPGPGTVGLAPSSSGADAAYTRRPRVRPPRRRRPGQCRGPRARELRRRTAGDDAMEGLRKWHPRPSARPNRPATAPLSRCPPASG